MAIGPATGPLALNELFRQSYCACAAESVVLAGIIKASLWLDTKKLERKARVIGQDMGKIWPNIIASRVF